MRAVFLGVLIALSSWLPAHASNLFASTQTSAFLAADQAFRFERNENPAQQATLSWRIAPGYYLYQQRLLINGQEASQITHLPEAQAYQDEFFGDVAIYRDHLEFSLPTSLGNAFEVSWQGCADAGLCYPPQTQRINLSDAELALKESSQADDQSLAMQLSQQALVWNLLLFFALGMLLAFAPCSLPMLPILASVVIGPQRSTKRSLSLALVYVVSMASIYAVLGVIAASLGSNLQAWLMQPWVIGSFAALFVLLALPMFGIFELQLPAFLRDRLEQAGRHQQGGSLPGAAMLGLLSGLLVGPCMTAPLAAILLFISQSGDVVQGALALFALGLGIGAPLVVLVTLGQRFLPKPGPWMNRLKAAFGFIFLLAALYVLRPILPANLWIGLHGAILLSIAAALLSLKPINHTAKVTGRCIALLALIWGLLLIIGASAGSHSLSQPLKVFTATPSPEQSHENWQTITQPAELQRALEQAQRDGQWVLIDYYADWCVACLVMEAEIFAHPEVTAALAGVRLLRPDVTLSGANSQALLEQFAVMGPPTIIFIGPDGQERRALRITGQVDRTTFLNRWQVVRDQG